jgi:hypothetical protein
MLLIFNVLILIVFAWEVNKTCEVMENKGVVREIKVRSLARIVCFAIFTGIALLILYKLFGLNDYNLDTYLQSGKI